MLVGDVLDVPEPVVDQPAPLAVERRQDAAAAEVAADHDLGDREHVDGVLQRRQAVQVGVHDEVRHVTVHEHLAGIGAGDLVGRHAAVGAPDPQVARCLLCRQAAEEPGVAPDHVGRPQAVPLEQVVERHPEIVLPSRAL